MCCQVLVRMNSCAANVAYSMGFKDDQDTVFCLEEGTQPDIFMSHKDATEAHAERHSDAFLPVLTCRTCGQHFFEGHYLDLGEVTTKAGLLKGFSGGNAVERKAGPRMLLGRLHRPKNRNDWSFPTDSWKKWMMKPTRRNSQSGRSFIFADSVALFIVNREANALLRP